MDLKTSRLLQDRPLESLLALALLFGLLFVAADGTQPIPTAGTLIATSEKN